MGWWVAPVSLWAAEALDRRLDRGADPFLLLQHGLLHDALLALPVLARDVLDPILCPRVNASPDGVHHRDTDWGPNGPSPTSAGPICAFSFRFALSVHLCLISVCMHAYL